MQHRQTNMDNHNRAFLILNYNIYEITNKNFTVICLFKYTSTMKTIIIVHSSIQYVKIDIIIIIIVVVYIVLVIQVKKLILVIIPNTTINKTILNFTFLQK